MQQRLLRSLWLAVVIVVACPASTQPHSFLVILRYNNVDIRIRRGIHACVIVGEDGQYHMESMPWDEQPNRKNTKVFTGRLSEDSLASLRDLLSARELLLLGDVEPTHEHTMIANSLEAVSLRILRNSTQQEVAYLDVDHSRSFPPPVRAFIPWLQNVISHKGEAAKGVVPNSCQFLEATPDFHPQLRPR